MEKYIKVYDWTVETGLNIEERFVLSLIIQHTEGVYGGYWAGYKSMSERIGIPKSRCRAIVQKLKDIGAVEETRKNILHQTRILLSAKPSFAAKFNKLAGARV